MSETPTTPAAPPPATAARTRRSIYFILGMLFALAAFVFTIAPREWFESDAEADEEETVDMQNLHEQSPEHQLAVLEKMWAEHPDHAPIALQIAQLYADQGAFVQAEKYYREFLKADTSSTGYEVGLDLAQMLFHQQKNDAAIAELKKILKITPGHAGALYNWGAIAANTGDQATAKKVWTELIEKHPTDTLAVFAKKSLPLLDKPAGHP